MHPKIDLSLVDLGMIKDVIVGLKTVTLTLVLSFMHIPIKGYLIQSAREAVKKLDADIEIDVKLAGMSQEERAAFMKIAREFWRGLGGLEMLWFRQILVIVSIVLWIWTLVPEPASDPYVID